MKQILGIGLLVLISFISIAQDKKGEKEAALLTADSLATGNYKDVLTSFFQLAFQNLTGPQKEIKFTSNPYAVLARGNKDLLIDKEYKKHYFLRNLNFGFGLKLDSNFKFNGFNGGVNFALINKRDYTVYERFAGEVIELNSEFNKFNTAVNKFIVDSPMTDELKAKVISETEKLLNNASFNYGKVSAEVKSVFAKVLSSGELKDIRRMLEENSSVSFAAVARKRYEEYRDSFKNKLLWTIGVSDTTYKDQFMFSNVVFSTQLLQGFGDPKKPRGWELDVKAQYNLLDDTLKAGRDLKRGLLSIEGGFNYVWRAKKTDLSFFEFKASAAYNRIFNGMYIDERKSVFTLNGQIRVRIYEDIWIPIEFKYDPENGNVFGLLNVKANFTSVKKLIGGAKG